MAAIKANFNDTFSLIYGSITVLGGIIGYLKAGSLASYTPPVSPFPANPSFRHQIPTRTFSR